MSNLIQLPHKFEFRDYQIDPWNAFVVKKTKRGIMVVPRRNGKDILCWNILIAKAFEHVGLYYYMAPYYNQIRQIIWEGYTKDGMRFLDYIPEELITNKTKLDMRIDLVNGSQIKLQGSDQIDRIVGTNPYGIVFTEFSLHKPGAWEYLRPILAENGGWAIFNGTPRSLNHFHDLYQTANKDEEWYVQYLTRDDTGVPSLEAIDDDRRSGMPEALIKQEYYCSFMSGVVGSYYADYIEKARDDNRITHVPYEPRLPVYTFWDLGVGDATSIWFAQIKGREVRFIDYHEAAGEGIPYYIKVLQDKPYVYDEHFAPHDIEVREFSTGVSRRETAQELGLDFTVVPKQSLEDGIEATRELISISIYDSDKCADGLNALMNYKKRFNETTQSYSTKPVHDWSSNGADAHRYAALSIPTIIDFSYSHVNKRFEIANRPPVRVIRSIGGVGKRSPTPRHDHVELHHRMAI